MIDVTVSILKQDIRIMEATFDNTVCDGRVYIVVSHSKQ